MAVVLAAPGNLIVQLVGIAVLVPPDPHERLAGRDGANPAPEAPLLPVPADAAADLEEGFLEHVFRVLRGATDATGEVVDRDLERLVQGPQRLGVSGASASNNRFSVG